MATESQEAAPSVAAMPDGGFAARPRYRRPELDVLRFVAFFFVLLHHMVPLGLGRLSSLLPDNLTPIIVALNRCFGFGLTLFFVLSAFLISELLTRERDVGRGISATRFYKRRILRVWPLYYFCLFIGLAIALLSRSGSQDVIRIAAFAVFMGAWDAGIHGWLQNPIAPLWSISLEEQFYFFAPWLFRYLRRGNLIFLGVLVIVCSSCCVFYMGQSRAEDYSVWASPAVQSQAFAAGMIYCLVLNRKIPRLSSWKRVFLAAGSLVLWFVAAYSLHVRYFVPAANPGGVKLMLGYWLGSGGAVLMLAGTLGSNPKLFPSWTLYLGRISYGLYAFHGFAVYLVDRILGQVINRVHLPAVALKFVPVIIIDIVLASASYRFLEKPFLAKKRRLAAISTEPECSSNG
jgi:peptidoglycan/LPS O-acetylase OafA/YrhL